MHIRRFALTLIALLAATNGSAQTPQRWRLVRDLHIGSLDRPNYSFSRISSLVTGPGGEIYVAQPMEGMIRVYDARGQYQRTIGRRGNGPGDFQDMERLGWKGDTLWAVDPALKRVSLFNARGNLLRTVGIQGPVVEGAGYPAGPSGLLADGTVIGEPRPSSSTISEGTAATVPLLQMNRASGKLGQFGTLDARGSFDVIRSSRLVMNFKLPVQTHTLWDLAPDGSSVVVVHRPMASSADPSSFTVTRWQSPPRVVFRKGYTYSPVVIGQEVRDSLRNDLVDLFYRKARFARSEREARSLVEDSVRIPRYFPPITGLAVGRDGSAWLRKGKAGQAEWLILDPQGRIVANAGAPAGLHILQVSRDLVWGVETDEFDVPYVVRYRIQRTK